VLIVAGVAEIAKELKPHIKAVVVVSAHWESVSDACTFSVAHAAACSSASVPGTADTWCPASTCALVARQDGGPTVTSWDGPRDLLFDYYNFPPESYKYKYPSPGSPQLAQRIVSLFG
jgi:aromatic ring-opening dioxygenase catalytic subunit (LigB family)